MCNPQRMGENCVLTCCDFRFHGFQATEFWSKISRNIFLSATPGKFELELSNPTMTSMLQASSGKPAGGASGLGWDEIGNLVDAQAVIRPTGIPDPLVDIRPSEGQVADLVQECRVRRDRGERVLVTVLTKRMAGKFRHEPGCWKVAH